MAVVHEIAGGVGLGRHGRQERGIFHRLDFQLHAYRLEVGGDQRQQVHVIGIAGADLDLEAESLGDTRFGQQLLRLVGIVGEELFHRVGHGLEGLVVAQIVGMLRIGEQFCVAAVVGLDDLLLVDRHVEGAADADVVERLGVDAHGQELPAHAEPARPLELRRRLLEIVGCAPADVLQQVELGGPQCRQVGRLVLDGAEDQLVEERKLVFLAADLDLVPVDRILAVGVGAALDEVAQHERAGAVHVLPVGGAGVGHLLGGDGRVVAPAEAVIPFGVEVLEGEDDGVLVRRLDLLDMIEVARDLLGAGAEPVIGEDDVLGRQLALLHDARLFGKHHALAQVDGEPQRVLAPHPFLRQLAADRVRGQPGVGVERILPAVLLALGEIGGEELLVELAGVVVELPVPVGRIERQGRQRHVDGAHLQRAAVLRLFLRQCRRRQQAKAQRTTEQRLSQSLHDRVPPHFLCSSLQRDPRMRGSSRSRSASPNMLVA